MNLTGAGSMLEGMLSTATLLVACGGVATVAIVGAGLAGAQPAPPTPDTTRVAVVPAPNARGWHASPARIVFECGDVTSDQQCRPPVVVDRDGANQRLDVAVMPGVAAGTPAVVVNLDQTAPAVSLRAPRDGARTTADRIDVAGTVTDVTSGIRWAACNGVRAAVVHGVVRCSVALAVGTNQVLLHAMDMAGNSGSAGVRVIRDDVSSPLTVVPSTFVMGTRESPDALFRALNAAGLEEPAAQWSVDRQGIVTLETMDGSAHLTAEGPGVVTLRARSRGRTATATVTVLDADDVRAGTTTWSMAPVSGQPHDRMLDTGWANDLNVTALLVSDLGTDRAIVRALSLTGLGPREVWRGRVDGQPETIDRRGGLLTRLDHDDAQALVRADGVGGSPIWRFDSEGSLGPADFDEDGRLYVVESDGRPGVDGSTRVAVLDGTTGRAIIRQALPGSRVVEVGCDGRTISHDEPADVGALVGVTDGVAATVVVRRVTHTQGCSAGRPWPGLGQLDITHRLVLMRITAEGVETADTVWQWHDAGPDTAAWLDTVQDAVPGPLLPSGDRSLLVFWGLATGTQAAVMHATTITPSSQRDVVPAAQGAPWQTMLLDVFETPAVILSDGQALHALDLGTGRTRRVAATPARPVAALGDDGHIVVNDEARGTLFELDAEGAVAHEWPLGIRAANIIMRDSDVIHGFGLADGAFVECAIALPLLGGAYGVIDLDGLEVPSKAHAALAQRIR